MDQPRPPEIPPSPKKERPWPLSWILIAVLLYALFQTTYFVFFARP